MCNLYSKIRKHLKFLKVNTRTNFEPGIGAQESISCLINYMLVPDFFSNVQSKLDGKFG